MRVLITGASGFTGRHVTAALEKTGAEVWGMESPGRGNSPLRCVSVDIAGDRKGIEDAVRDIRPTHVLHLAAQSHVTNSTGSAHYATNVIGTENLLRALSSTGIPLEQVILASSANVYGTTLVREIDETHPVRPVNHYGFSKMVMEQMADIWYPHLPILITRPFNYTGVGQSEEFLVPKLVGHFGRGERRIRLGNTNVARDISDVRTVADVYVKLLQSASSRTVINICRGEAISISGMLGILEKLAGYSIEIEVDPGLVRQNEIPELCGNPTRLREHVSDLEVRPIASTLAWMYEAVCR
jgi:GDP-6-deoxy-D-talose 4-dehydrogenase